MLGNLMTLASGCFTNSPSWANALGWRCASVNRSGKMAIILPAKEMSLVSISIPAGAINFLTIGRKEAVASAGASSVFVYMILG